MEELRHDRYIDALRGFAFLGVLTVHAAQQVPSLPGRSVALAGQYGVQLFFLLSAVTLLRSLTLRSRQEHSPVRNFFIRRFFRIAPLFWCGIGLYSFLHGDQPQFWAPHGVHPGQLISTALFLHGWWPTTINSVVPGGWSIAVEMTFYLCLPLLSSRISSLGPALKITFYALAASVVVNAWAARILTRFVPLDEANLIPLFLNFWFPSQLPVFLLGFVVFYGLQHDSILSFLSAPRRCLFLVMIAAYGFVGLAPLPPGISLLIPVHFGYAILLAILIFALKVRPFPALVNSLTCGLGTISFSCYLNHFWVIDLVVKFLQPGSFSSLPPALLSTCHFVSIWISGLILTVAASILTYHVVEKPGIKLGNLLVRVSESRRQVMESAPAS